MLQSKEKNHLINIKFPDMSPVDETDSTSSHIDSRFSGKYLITSIHHKINILKHFMSMEVIRDSVVPTNSDVFPNRPK